MAQDSLSELNEYVNVGDIKRAESLFKSLLERASTFETSPELVGARIKMAQVYLSNNNYDEALNQINEAIATSAEQGLIAEQMTAYRVKAQINHLQQDERAANAALENALALAQKQPQADKTKAILYRELADAQWRIGNADSARAHAANSLDLAKQLSDHEEIYLAQLKLAQLVGLTKDYGQAERLLKLNEKEAEILNSNLYRCQIPYQRALIIAVPQGDLELALAELQQALTIAQQAELKQQEIQIYELRAQLYQSFDQLPEAIEEFRLLLEFIDRHIEEFPQWKSKRSQAIQTLTKLELKNEVDQQGSINTGQQTHKTVDINSTAPEPINNTSNNTSDGTTNGPSNDTANEALLQSKAQRPPAAKKSKASKTKTTGNQNSATNSRQTTTDENDPTATGKQNNILNLDVISRKSASDIWTTDDHLGYDAYAQAIAKIILDGKAEPPLTLSIQAPWGQGKTSLMRMIKEKIESGLAEKPAAENQANKPEENEQPATPGIQSNLKILNRWLKETESAPSADMGMLTTPTNTLPCIWFNPLYYQNSEQVWSGLAHTILHQLASKLDPLAEEKFWFKLRLARLDTQAIRRDIHKLLLGRWLPKGLTYLSASALTLTTTALTTVGNTWLSALPIAAAGVDYLLYQFKENKNWALDDKLAHYISEPQYDHNLGLLHLVDEDLDRALELLLGERGKLVVFIDDLDRCPPDTVNDIMLAINQFISVKSRRLIFILGMDTHMVAMALESATAGQAQAYNQSNPNSKGFGWRFMEKFIQLPFFIPRINEQDAKQYLNHLLAQQDKQTISSARLSDFKQEIQQSQSMQAVQEVLQQYRSEFGQQITPEITRAATTRVIEMSEDKDNDTLRDLIDAAVSDLDYNPRDMKRFLNIARLLFTRFDYEQQAGNRQHMLKVVRASHIVLNWPQSLRWLQGNTHRYTQSGEKLDPVESLQQMLKSADDYPQWREQFQHIWGLNLAQAIALPDFYLFLKRIETNPPGIGEIFAARLF